MLLNIFYIAIALFALGFCIFIHELGHFVAAKKRGLVADRFSIGFGPRLFGWNWKGTDFRLSLIPLGGYVSLPQLVDMGRLEGGEEDEADKLPPISYADKMIVAVMGAVFNLIFAFVLSLVLWGVGREIVKSTEVGYVAQQLITSDRETVAGPGQLAGVKVGDTVISVDGQTVRSWMQYQNALMTGTGRADDVHDLKAWKLIDAAGLRGARLGGARMSEKHPNFLINTGTATAADLEKLGERVRKKVYDSSGIKLEWEIMRVGDPGADQ
jgi:regulator of sigma E protease